VRKDGASWKEAVQDGWVPGQNLFEVEEAIKKGTIVMNLLSDAAQKETWPKVKPLLTKGKVRLLFQYFPGIGVSGPLTRKPTFRCEYEMSIFNRQLSV
jgi:ketol-acid reductoisomerase